MIMKKNLLFICTENRHRSPTAEKLFKNSDKYNAKSAGTSPLAKTKLTKKALDWADMIFVMEDHHERQILKNFPKYSTKQIINLNVPDRFQRDDLRLKRLLKERLKKWIDI